MNNSQNNKLSENVLTFIVALGILLRVYFALARTDLVWADEHFQTLEPASKAVWGFGYMAWEWKDGFRSWLGPFPYILLFSILKLLGIQGGPVPIYAARIFAAFVSGSALWVLHRWFAKLGFSFIARYMALVFFALHPAMVLWGVTTLTDHLALNVLIIILPVLFTEPASFRSGFLLGLTFLARFQMIAFLPGYFIFLLIQKTPLRTILRFSSGYFVCSLILGVVDWATWGAPYRSLTNQLFYGVKISQNYGVEPWWKYFGLLSDNLRLPVVIALLVVGTSAFLFTCFSQRLQQYRSLFLFVTLPALGFFFLHSYLPHKEARFILPVYASFLFWIAIFFEHWKSKWILFQENRRLTVTCSAAVVVLAFCSFYLAKNQTIYLSEVNLFDLETATFRDGKLLRLPQEKRCILTAVHNWSWSHGYLIQGTDLQFIEIKDALAANEKKPTIMRTLSDCPYAWVYRSRALEFLKSAPEKWELMAESKISSYNLYRQIEF